MPEIIKFSNDLCYKDEPLIPLRQFGAGRLEPVVKAVYVKNGYKKGKDINPPEASEIARKIAELIRDPNYEGKSFGVIALQGYRQARYIENELMSLVDSKELSARSLICGDPYRFQGDERDIIFLSMVTAAPADGIVRALSNPKGRDERRFNVAVSRAKDQLWLFHSVTLNDLSEADLRFRLLSYCQNPVGNQDTVSDVSLEDLRTRSLRANRSAEKPPGVFDSWFEVDVCLRIIDKGYRVEPQYEVHGYRIDLAVIGKKAKLAVECDGDEWHGPERWESDNARQRDLERCGWPFFRIRASTYYLDPVTALEPLWEELNRQGIHPVEAEAIPEASPDTDAEREAIAASMSRAAKDMPPKPVDDVQEFSEQDSSLLAYTEWEPSYRLPDPRTAPRESVLRALIDIVETEGPVTWRRVFDRYRFGLRMGRLRGSTRQALKNVAIHAYETNRLSGWLEKDPHEWYDYVVHTPESPRVKVRQRGPRDLEDVPCSEIAELMHERNLVDADEEWGFRQVLSAYGLRRLTEAAKDHLRTAAQMARSRLSS